MLISSVMLLSLFTGACNTEPNQTTGTESTTTILPCFVSPF
jgi:hypothetical protein